MAVKAALVTVGTSPTRLDAAGEGDSVSGHAPLARNMGAVTVYVGGSDVTTGAGYPLEPGEQLGADFSGNDQLYGIVATGTAPVRVLQSGV